MSIITLTSDWNQGDYYVSSMKGKIYSLIPDAVIIDINHQIPAFSYIKAAFVIKNCYQNFPEGTVHLICVNSEASMKMPHVAVMYNNHYFIGTDNGFFGLLFDNQPVTAVELPASASSFPELEVFVEFASQLIKGNKIEKLGKPRPQLNLPAPYLATLDNSVINGSVIYIDSYRNAITNITHEMFEMIGKGRRFEILVQSNHYKVKKINQFYNQTPEGELLALFNSAGLLEIAINKGFVADLLNLSANSVVRIKFYDTPEREELKLL